jgi:molecular chaperone GrpE
MTEEELNDTTSSAKADAPEEEPGVTSLDEELVEVDETGDTFAALEEKLAQAEARLAEAEKLAAEYRDGWQRAQASFVNYRKRTESEQAQAQAAANARLLLRILPVMDDFKRAFENVPEAYRDDPWLEGIRLVERKLKSVLDSANVKPIEVNSKDSFDPNFHQAVLYQEVEGFGEGDVVAEIETGYLLGDRVLRPSLVVVAKGRAGEDVEEAALDIEGEVYDAEDVASDAEDVASDAEDVASDAEDVASDAEDVAHESGGASDA